MAEINDLQEKLAAQQIETMEGNEQKRIEGLKSLNEAAAALERDVTLGFTENDQLNDAKALQIIETAPKVCYCSF